MAVQSFKNFSVTMRPETAERLEKMRHEFFETDEYASVRAVLFSAPKNDDEREDLDTVLDRIDKFAPDMHKFIDSFLYPSQ